MLLWLSFYTCLLRWPVAHTAPSLNASCVLGEDTILYSDRWKERHCAMAYTYLEVHLLERDDIFEVPA